MFNDVWNSLIKTEHQRTTATLKDYIRLKVKGEHYPGIIKSVNSVVNGVLVFNLSDDDLAILDDYEGDCYQRTSINVICKENSYCQADTYVFKDSYKNILSANEWIPEEFKKDKLNLFLSSYKNFHS